VAQVRAVGSVAYNPVKVDAAAAHLVAQADLLKTRQWADVITER